MLKIRSLWLILQVYTDVISIKPVSHMFKELFHFWPILWLLVAQNMHLCRFQTEMHQNNLASHAQTQSNSYRNCRC